MMKFQGAFTALVTPMKEDGAVDYEGFRRLIDFQISEGIDGLVPLGTTGETSTLEEDEEERLIKIAVEEAKGRVPLIIGAGSNNTRDMVRYVKRAKDMGADAAMVVTPYYNKPNDDGLLSHFKAAGEIGIPIIVYNIASRTGLNIPTPLMKKIADIPNIAGVKESSGDLKQICEVIDSIAAPRKTGGAYFSAISGDDLFALPMMNLGGDGIVSVISNLVPARVKALAKACFDKNQEEARKIHFELFPLTKAAFVETNPAPIKLAMNWAGLPAGPCRLPMGKLSKASEEILRTALTGMGLSVK